mmetsp:Transcript_6334/g.14309  ORF Transcript_6334/g.14309 Transcript_6334/m.14309 type:complete len:238 (+) Transcript_6334:1086-1799(+)
MFVNPIPTEIARITYLSQIRLGNNLFTGPLPCSTLAQLGNLWELDLEGNSFNGTICQGISGSLWTLNLAHNELTGTVPFGLIWLLVVESVDLSSNSLTGPLPTSMINANTRFVSLGKNRFSGRIPSVLGTSSEFLEHFSFEENEITGTLPSEFGELSRLQSLKLSGNRDITGTIPTEFANMLDLYFLEVNGTQVTGSVPDGICDRLLLGPLENYTFFQNYTIRVDCTRVQCGCCVDC